MLKAGTRVGDVLVRLGLLALAILAAFVPDLSGTGALVSMGAIVVALGIDAAFVIWKDARAERLLREQFLTSGEPK